MDATVPSGSQPTLEELFYQKYDEYVSHNRKNPHVLSDAGYAERLNAVLMKERGQTLGSGSERNWAKRFSMRLEGGEYVLLRSEEIVVRRSDLFKLIHEAHVVMAEHGGQIATQRFLANYSGITKEVIGLYISLCRECEPKRTKARKSLTAHSAVSDDAGAAYLNDLLNLFPVTSYQRIAQDDRDSADIADQNHTGDEMDASSCSSSSVALAPMPLTAASEEPRLKRPRLSSPSATINEDLLRTALQSIAAANGSVALPNNQTQHRQRLRVLGDSLEDVLLLLDRPTLDTLQLASSSFNTIILAKMRDVCKREIGAAEIRNPNDADKLFIVTVQCATPRIADAHTPFDVLRKRFGANEAADAVKFAFHAMANSFVRQLTLDHIQLDYLAMEYIRFFAPSVIVRHMRFHYCRVDADLEVFIECLTKFQKIEKIFSSWREKLVELSKAMHIELESPDTHYV